MKDVAGANDDLKTLVRTIPDFPKPGIQFRDVTTCCSMRAVSPPRSSGWRRRSSRAPDLVAAIEARGFILGSALAREPGCGLLSIRKDGKLPGATIAEDYALEYSDCLTMHVDACVPGARVLLTDDLDRHRRHGAGGGGACAARGRRGGRRPLPDRLARASAAPEALGGGASAASLMSPEWTAASGAVSTIGRG